MHVQFSAAVFKIVFEAIGSVRQLARLAQRHQGLLDLQGQWGGEQEATRLGGGDGVDALRLIVFRKPPNRLSKGAGIREQGCDILEENSRLGEVRDVADVLRQIHWRSSGNVSERSDYEV